MSTLPLELHQILEEEYVSMYGPLPRPAATCSPGDVIDARWACTILQECGFPPADDARGAAEQLCALVTGEGSLDDLRRSPAITARGRVLLDDYEPFAEIARKENGAEGVRELRRAIVDEAFCGAVKPLRDVRLANVYSALHQRAGDPADPRPRSALCISGGGIRSATFALGVIQGLANANVLDKFDYLSTVSGGGYIGSWLSSWSRRHPKGVSGVKEDLQQSERRAITDNIVPAESTHLPDQKIKPEPKPVGHLREYSNYLSPRLGLFSGDTWTLVSLYVRNLLLNLLVLVPLLAFVLAFPRMFSWVLEFSSQLDRQNLIDPPAWAWIFAGFTTLGFAYLGWKRPVEQGRQAQEKARTVTTDGRFILFCVLPLTLAAMALAVFWARLNPPHGSQLALLKDPSTIGAAVLALVGMTVVPYVLYYSRYFLRLQAERRAAFASAKESRKASGRKQVVELIATLVAMATTAVLLWLLAVKVFDAPLRPVPIVETQAPIERAGQVASPQAQIYVCFAVPLLLLVFFVQASIFVGLSSKHSEDYDREWWGRAGAWLIVSAAVLAVGSAVAVFGPMAFYYAPLILGSAGVAAGAGAAMLGYSDKTSATQKEEAGAAKKAANISGVVMVPLFVLAVLAAISLGTTWLVQQLRDDPAVLKPAQYAELAALKARYVRPEATQKGAQILDTTLVPRISMPALASIAHLQTIQRTSGTEILILFAVAAFGVGLSFFIGVNRFSMQALYRNRIIRGYLGASRYARDPDRFTGFDENDNLQMWELRPELLWTTQIRDPKGLVDALQDRGNTLGWYLWNELEESTRKAVKNGISGVSVTALAQNLNAILLEGDLTKSGVQPPSWVTTTDGQIGYSRAVRNRAILDASLNRWIEPMAPPADAKGAPATNVRRSPAHVVNAALNLTSGENLAWQQRKAESFTVSPLHSGSLFLGYRPSREYGGKDGISLGTAVAISGAAASPNMGYHSSQSVAFLLTLLNVRLGSWLGNPGARGQKAYRKAHPTTGLATLFAELTGNSNDKSKWVYLSDGGHFENLALYEMVLRRCHRIVLSDGGADPKCSFEDLGNAIRKIRIDLGIPIEIAPTEMHPRTKEGKLIEGQYFAFAKIRYSAVDRNAVDGELIYFKPGVYKGEHLPWDVYNYSQASAEFPHEPTGDQFFSESQFESYRALGRHAVNELCGNYPATGTAEPRLTIAKQWESVDAFTQAVRAPRAKVKETRA